MRGDNPKIQQCAGKRVPVGHVSVKTSNLELCLWNKARCSKVVQTWPGCDLFLGPWKTEQTCLRGKEVTQGT